MDAVRNTLFVQMVEVGADGQHLIDEMCEALAAQLWDACRGGFDALLDNSMAAVHVLEAPEHGGRPVELYTDAYFVDANPTYVRQTGDVLLGFVADGACALDVMVGRASQWTVRLHGPGRFAFVLPGDDVLPTAGMYYSDIMLRVQQLTTGRVRVRCVWGVVGARSGRQKLARSTWRMRASIVLALPGGATVHYDGALTHHGFFSLLSGNSSYQHEVLLPSVPQALRGHAARVVQRAWRRCVCDPAYLVCRRRLERELADLLVA